MVILERNALLEPAPMANPWGEQGANRNISAKLLRTGDYFYRAQNYSTCLVPINNMK